MVKFLMGIDSQQKRFGELHTNKGELQAKSDNVQKGRRGFNRWTLRMIDAEPSPEAKFVETYFGLVGFVIELMFTETHK